MIVSIKNVCQLNLGDSFFWQICSNTVELLIYNMDFYSYNCVFRVQNALYRLDLWLV